MVCEQHRQIAMRHHPGLSIVLLSATREGTGASKIADTSFKSVKVMNWFVFLTVKK
jgi:hypothetical protein